MKKGPIFSLNDAKIVALNKTGRGSLLFLKQIVISDMRQDFGPVGGRADRCCTLQFSEPFGKLLITQNVAHPAGKIACS